ncbi:MAG: hypothetical protein ABJ251_23335 [Paracoccaceae bacterium]
MTPPETARPPAIDTAQQKLETEQARPAAIRTGETPGWPRTRGNVWMLDQAADGKLRYMSDVYGGRVLGYEEVDGVAIAQTPPLALAMLALGTQVAIERPLREKFEWHALEVDASGSLHGRGPTFAARSHAVAAQRLAESHGQALRTIAAISQPQSSMTRADLAADGAMITGLLSRLRSTVAALAERGKTVFADRISLSLLDGEMQLSEYEVGEIYADTARMLAGFVAPITGQASPPVTVVSQSCGTNARALAEGRLDIDHPTAGIIVATPSHPFPQDPNLRGAPTPKARMLIDELEARAVAKTLDGKRWYCPRLRQAWIDGTRIIAEFTTLSNLISSGSPQGFGFAGYTGKCPQIIKVALFGSTVQIDVDALPQGDDVFLTYAHGPSADGSPDNYGNIHDTWAANSLQEPGQILHRYALSCRCRIMPSDLKAKHSEAKA